MSEEKYYAAEEQGIEEDENSEKKKEKMEHGDRDEDVYSKEGREKLVEDGEIDPIEAGIMEGAAQAGQLGKDALTGEAILGEAVEIEIDGKVYRFVSEENAEEFRKKKEREN